MFTGLVEDLGTVEGLERRGEAASLRLRTRLEAGPIGASLAVDGACLTVTACGAGWAAATAGAETLERTTLGSLRPGDAVNLERPLRLGDRLGGHLVTGHVDAVGAVAGRREIGPSLELRVRAGAEVLRYVVEKGSVAVDGVSLTVNAVDAESFAVLLVPHTRASVTLERKPIGARVNLETDIIGKYVERFVAARAGGEGVTMDLLRKHGYM